MIDLRALLTDASVIDVIDWPHQDVPATLVRAGYTVVAPIYPPPEGAERFLVHEVWDELPEGAESFPITGGGFLGWRAVTEIPGQVDIVCTYRPPEEQAEIVEEAMRLRARVVWVEPPVKASPMAREFAQEFGLSFIEDISIAEAVSHYSSDA